MKLKDDLKTVESLIKSMIVDETVDEKWIGRNVVAKYGHVYGSKVKVTIRLDNHVMIQVDHYDIPWKSSWYKVENNKVLGWFQK